MNTPILRALLAHGFGTLIIERRQLRTSMSFKPVLGESVAALLTRLVRETKEGDEITILISHHAIVSIIVEHKEHAL